jgi:hypothetical protein
MNRTSVMFNCGPTKPFIENKKTYKNRCYSRTWNQTFTSDNISLPPDYNLTWDYI